MKLYLPDSVNSFDLRKSKEQTHETRGGKYAARVQVGWEKDGSPMYRYFKTKDEYDSYLHGRGGKKKKQQSEAKKQAKRLKEKVDKEHKDSSDKKEPKDKKNLLSGKSDKKVNKSARLYLGD